MNSTRVANELGSGNSKGAVLAVRVMMTMVICEGSTVAVLTILVRHVWGKLYSNDPQVIHYVASMMPLLALSDFLDGFQCVLSGFSFSLNPISPSSQLICSYHAFFLIYDCLT